MEAFEHLGIKPSKPGKTIGNRIGGESRNEADHLYVPPACGQAVNKRDLDKVLHHEV